MAKFLCPLCEGKKVKAHVLDTWNGRVTDSVRHLQPNVHVIRVLALGQVEGRDVWVETSVTDEQVLRYLSHLEDPEYFFTLMEEQGIRLELL